MGSGVQANAITTQTRDLRQAQSRLNRKQHERVVTSSEPRVDVRGAQKCVNLVSCEKPDLCARESLVRDGQNPLNLGSVGGHLKGRIPKERANGGQSQVSACIADAATGLHVFEECGDQRCVDLLEGQLLRRNAETLVRELQQQPKAVPI